jgi:NADPH:quinone reductase-like Zn-dependent oxidoreductase
MQAIVYKQYGAADVLHIAEIDKPVPGDNQILIKTCATSVNYGDLVARHFSDVSPAEFNMPGLFWIIAKLSFGLKKPRNPILGSEFAGEIEQTGKNVSQFKKGDAVFGYLGQKMGAYAEYIVMSEKDCVTQKPANMNFKEAATIPMGAVMAIHLLEKAGLVAGQKVLINGASGSIGSAAVQIAKHLGAEVTGVCGNARMEFAKALGADKVIDYSKEDFTQSDDSYDLVFDILGKTSFAKCKRVLKSNGIYFSVSFKTGKLLQMIWTSIKGGKKVMIALAPGGKKDLLRVKELIEAGKIKTHIDKIFSMKEAAEAHRYVEEGHKKGNIILTITDNS